jgi:ribosomal protein S3AE
MAQEEVKNEFGKNKKDIGKKKKKNWFTIYATKDFRDAEIGLTPCNDDSDINGRVVKIGLMDLTGDMRNQNAKVKFKVKEIKGDKAFTELLGYELNVVNLKRLIKKNRKRLDDSFECVDKDNVKLVVKTIFLVRGDAPNSVMTVLRRRSRELISASLKLGTYEQGIMGIITKRIQNETKAELKKVYPLQIVEIRFLERKI